MAVRMKEFVMQVDGSALIAKMRKAGRSAAAAVASGTHLDFSDRETLIKSSQRAALSDKRFVDLVHAADHFRDQRNWLAAEANYAAALSLYPYQASYWAQHGHMAKEQEHFARAEISYRSACALGARPLDVIEHLNFVLIRQKADPARYPVRFYKPGPTALQPPAEADAVAFARLIWRVGGLDDQDMLNLLRSNANCDELLAAMIADIRFERANRDWLELVREGEL